MTNPAAKVVALAHTQVGVHEGRNASGWDNVQKYSEQVPSLTWSNGEPWCATFMSWLALKSGFAALYPRTASVQVAHDWFKSRGQLSTEPSIGAQFILNTSEHTGLVIDFNATTVWTIEGNTNNTGSPQGDGVYALTRPRSDKRLTYGHPKFPAAPKEPVVATPPVETHWSRLRKQLLADFYNADALAISKNRPVIRAFIASARTFLKKSSVN